MENLKKICDGVYRSNGTADESEIKFDGMDLFRFMNVFYIRGASEDLTEIQVKELCKERALDPASFSGTNSRVKGIFKSLIGEVNPGNFLEIGAGTNPILQDSEAGERGINYVRSDADPGNTDGKNVFSGSETELHHSDEYFDMAAAVFVLHFHFYLDQISELYRCLKHSGIFVANVYRRTAESRSELRGQFEQKGFTLLTLSDPINLCQDHEYWIVSKDPAKAQMIFDVLQRIAAER